MFLTLEDPRAKIQGSRDPLGLQPIWTSFGRRLVFNLTTVSTSVRGFTTLLLGRLLAHELIDSGKAREEDALPIFLRTEQACAFARVARNGDESLRGIERVKERLAASRTKARIENGPDGWILSDQKTYGLWGLFSVPARASGLLDERPFGVTPLARRHFEKPLARLRPARASLDRLVRSGGMLPLAKGSKLADVLAAVLSPQFEPEERDFYARILRDGEECETSLSARGRQAVLAGLLPDHTDLGEPISREDIDRLARAALPMNDSLAGRLAQIGQMEAVLAPSEVLFDFLLGRHGQTLDEAASVIRNRWGGRVPRLDFDWSNVADDVAEATSPDAAALLGQCHDALARGRYADAALATLNLNEGVRRRRGGAPWVRIGSRRQIDVRYRGAQPWLPEGDELPDLWRNSYFLSSLKEITRQLEEPQ